MGIIGLSKDIYYGEPEKYDINDMSYVYGYCRCSTNISCIRIPKDIRYLDSSGFYRAKCSKCGTSIGVKGPNSE